MKDLIVKYDDELIYRGKDLFGFKIKEDVDKSKITFELVDHDREECQKFFESDFE